MEPQALLSSLDDALLNVADAISQLEDRLRAREQHDRIPPAPPQLKPPAPKEKPKEKAPDVNALRQKMLRQEKLSPAETMLLANAGELLAGTDLTMARLQAGLDLSADEIAFLRCQGLYFAGDLETSPSDKGASWFREKNQAIKDLATDYSANPRPDVERIGLDAKEQEKFFKYNVKNKYPQELAQRRNELIAKLREEDLKRHREEVKDTQRSESEVVERIRDELEGKLGHLGEAQSPPIQVVNLSNSNSNLISSSTFSSSSSVALAGNWLEPLIREKLDKLAQDPNRADAKLAERELADRIRAEVTDPDAQAEALQTLQRAFALIEKRIKQGRLQGADSLFRTSEALKSAPEEEGHSYQGLHPGEFEDYNVPGLNIGTIKSSSGEELVKARTHQMTDEERAQSTLRVEDGRLVRGDGSAHDTSQSTAIGSFSGESHGKEMWVETEEGEIRAGSQEDLSSGVREYYEGMRKGTPRTKEEVEARGMSPEVEVAHHTTLGDGKGVKAAGEMETVEGKIHTLTNSSGHYKPGMEALSSATERLSEQGAFSRAGTVKDTADRNNPVEYKVSEVTASRGDLNRLRLLHEEMLKRGVTDPARIAQELREALEGTTVSEVDIQEAIKARQEWQARGTLLESAESPSVLLEAKYKELIRSGITDPGQLKSALERAASEVEQDLASRSDDETYALTADAKKRLVEEMLALHQMRVDRGQSIDDPQMSQAARKLIAQYQKKATELLQAYLKEKEELEEQLSPLGTDDPQRAALETKLAAAGQIFDQRKKALERQLNERAQKLQLSQAELDLILHLEDVTARRREMEDLRGSQGVRDATRGASLEEAMRRRKAKVDREGGKE